MADATWLLVALALYGLAAWQSVAALRTTPGGAAARVPVHAALGVAIAAHTVALGLRWQAHGHGPFTTMHEILSSNLWSLALALGIAALCVREMRQSLWAAMPVLAVLALWMLLADARPGHLPPTYATPLLYLHTIVGKAFLGLLLVAMAFAAVPLLRCTSWGRTRLHDAPDDRRFDDLAYRCAAFSFVFETLMLIVGAVWAQDAWGRYWAWDPLESWAFATWTALALALHARATLRPAPAVFGLWLTGVFVVAFLTFFGVPFLSTAPHKGAV